MAPRYSFLEFQRKLIARLDKGAEEYGDKSYSLQPKELLREIEEELLDVCGWAYILHTRLEKMQEALENATKAQTPQESLSSKFRRSPE